MAISTKMLSCLRILVVVVILARRCESETDNDDMQPEFNLRRAPACYTVLNTKGPVGCRSPTPGGTVASIARVTSQFDLDTFTQLVNSTTEVQSKAVLLPSALLTSDNLLALQQSGRCAGVILEDSTSPPPQGFSPADPMPYCKCGAAPPCTDKWNPDGNGLEQRSFDFPMISITEAEAATIRRRMLRASPDPTLFPQYQVQMSFYMDAFQGYTFEMGTWWEMEGGTRCCKNCRPNCGSACCREEFSCVSAATNPNVSWASSKCARKQEPTSLSCIASGTCLPIGGYNIWSINSVQLPIPPLQPPALQAAASTRIVMVTANLDSSSLFHDMAGGASADGSAVIALIAAADALRGLRADMAARGGAAIMFTLLQAENWDHIGSRRLFHDMTFFKCRKRRGAAGGMPSAACLCSIT